MSTESQNEEIAQLREHLYVRGEHMREMSDEFVRVLAVALNKHSEVLDELHAVKEQNHELKIENSEQRLRMLTAYQQAAEGTANGRAET